MEVKIAVVLYIAATAILALVMARRNKTSKEFFLGSAGLGTVFVLTMIFSETIGGTGTVGDCAEAFSSVGMGAVWSTWGMAFGCLLFVLVFGKFYRVLGARRGVKSVAGAYEVMFGRRTKAVVLAIVAVVYACIFALQPVAAAGVLAPMLGIDRDLTLVAAGVLFVIVACTGGLRGLARMNKVHAFCMWFGLLVVALLAVRSVGGVQGMVRSVPEGYLNVFYPGFDVVAIWVLGAIFSQMSSAILATVCLSADNLRAMRRGTAVSVALMMTFACFPAIAGICASIAMPDADPQQALYVFSQHLSPWVGGLASVAVIAAIFSTAPSVLLIVGTTLSEDLYRGFINPAADDGRTIIAARVSMAAVGAAAIVLALQTTSIFSQLLSIFQIRSIVAIVLIVALAWPRVNERAAFWAILCGGGLAAVWHFLGAPFGIQPLIPSAICGIVLLTVFTAMSKEKVSAGHRNYLEAKREYESEEGVCPHRREGVNPMCSLMRRKAVD